MLGITAALLLHFLHISQAGNPYWYDAPQTLPNRTLMVHLFEWKWPDIAKECEDFLQHHGYGAVQISPPNEHIMIDQGTNCPWWVRYQPVSYKLESRSGTEQEFKNMVERCNKVGVRIIVDVVLNHMAAVNQKKNEPGIWSSGPSDFNSRQEVEEFPGVPYGPKDFHDHICNGSIAGSDYQNNANNVRNCRLDGLLDLDHSQAHVRERISEYLNRLIDAGVAGLRIDASKHMHPNDLESILGMVKNLRTDIFGANQRPFAVHEVIDRGGEAISLGEYVNAGRYTNFNFGPAVSRAIKKEANVQDLSSLGKGFNYGNLGGHDVLSFIDNHDNQREAHTDVLTYKDGDLYKLGVSFMLAWSYGYPRVMSSYYFDSRDQGPPNEGKNNAYKSSSPRFSSDGTCDQASGFVCEHRWSSIRGMAIFHSATEGAAVTLIRKEDQRVAFARRGRGFYALNNADTAWEATFETSLPAGKYCDHYKGNVKNPKECIGSAVEVDQTGKATIKVEPRTAIAISIASRLGGPPPPASPSVDTSKFKPTIIFFKANTTYGDNVFVRGGNSKNKDCSLDAQHCSIAIQHNTTTTDLYAEYRSWSQGDEHLDFGGAEPGQGTHDGAPPYGTPLIYTTTDKTAAEYQVANKYGPGYWMVQVLMNCDETNQGYFEVKGFLNNEWEPDVSQVECTGSAGGKTPSASGKNHIGQCGAVNVFEWAENGCIMDKH